MNVGSGGARMDGNFFSWDGVKRTIRDRRRGRSRAWYRGAP